jgi:hypothetical protein
VKFNKHFKLEGIHAFLAPSKYAWVGYDEEKLEGVYANWKASQLGTELHELAAKLINLRVKLPDTNERKFNKTLNMYVNDGIGFRMQPEVCLFYSINCFGTADTISFHNNFLRIHDLKNGRTAASIQQLRIYAALFCLEYGYNPRDIDIELRIYQSDEVVIENPNPEDILYVMDKIVLFDKRINEIKE